MAVTIASDLLRDLATAAERSPDREICGLLLGTDARIAAALACRNVAADPAHRFEIEPGALIAAHRAARTGGAAVVGHYHSHPSGDPLPSLRDAAEAAADGAVWLILAGGTARAWRAVAAGTVHGRFVPLALRVEPGTATRAVMPQEEE